MSKDVYIVESGCKYEGGATNAIFSTEELARKFALELVEDKNKWFEEVNSDKSKDCYFEPFSEKKRNEWENGVDFIRVSVYELDKIL